MKQAWMIGGIVCLSLLSGGCKTGEFLSGNQGPDGKGATLQAAHDAVAEESASLDARQAKEKGDADSIHSQAWEDAKQETKRDAHFLASDAPQRDIHDKVAKEAEEVNTRGDRLRSLENVTPAAVPMPVLPQYDRLTDIMVSLEMDKVDVRQALRALAKQTSMNLLLDPVVLDEAPLVTVSFQKVSAATVLREVLQLADLYGVIEDNILRVLPFQEVVIPLNFLETNVTSSFDSGGDVLGANKEVGGSLKGGFSMSGGAKSTNPYEPIEKAVTALVGEKKGSFQINRQTGTLFMRAKPSAIKTVTDLVHRYKEILGRQILIETRILEVTLSDQYQAGINWALLRSNLSLTSGITQSITPGPAAVAATAAAAAVPGMGVATVIPSRPGLALGIPSSSTAPISSALGALGTKAAGLGLSLAGDKGLAFVDLLKQFGDVRTLSNPTIRARHAQPAMISVGKSVTFVKTRTQEASTFNPVTGATVPGKTTDTPATLFDGVMMGVVPFISTDGKITLSVHPIQSALEAGTEEVKGVDTISRPKVNLKEISTILELQDHDTVLLGGLIDKSVGKYRTGMPILSEIPVLGRMFTHDQETETARELVIMMRVTVL